MKEVCYIIMIFCLISACNNKENHEIPVDLTQEIEIDSGIALKKVCDLEDSINVIGEINSFCFVDKEMFAVSSIKSAKVIVYNNKGKKLFKIGNKGNGPYEYISPSLVRTSNRKIYVWCSMKLKLLVFDIHGKPIQEYTNFTKAIKDFYVYENYICFYSSGGFDDPTIQIYDLVTKRFTKNGFGTQSNEHKILNSYSGSGGLSLSGKTLFFAPNDKLCINKVDLSNWSISSFLIKDKEFEVEKVSVDHVEFMADPKSIKYIFGSDIVNELISTDNNIILISEVGKIELDGIKIDNSKRRQKIYLLNKNLDLKYTIKTKIREGSTGLFSSLGDDLYTLKLNEDFSTYHLCMIDFNEMTQKGLNKK